MGAISYSELTYKRKTFEYKYPSWAIGVGWMMALVSVIWIPIIFFKRVIDAEGSLAQVYSTAKYPLFSKEILREFVKLIEH